MLSTHSLLRRPPTLKSPICLPAASGHGPISPLSWNSKAPELSTHSSLPPKPIPIGPFKSRSVARLSAFPSVVSPAHLLIFLQHRFLCYPASCHSLPSLLGLIPPPSPSPLHLHQMTLTVLIQLKDLLQENCSCHSRLEARVPFSDQGG